MRGLFWRVVINAITLYITAMIVPGIVVGDDIATLGIIGLIFGVVNAIIGPILRLLTCPLQVLTLGLFTFVINAVLLWLTSFFAQQLGADFHVEGIVPALIGGVVVTIISVVLSIFLPDDKRR